MSKPDSPFCVANVIFVETSRFAGWSNVHGVSRKRQMDQDHLWRAKRARRLDTY